jgi:hypothetical protein
MHGFPEDYVIYNFYIDGSYLNTLSLSLFGATPWGSSTPMISMFTVCSFHGVDLPKALGI